VDEMAEAGKKITASISQAWEEYLQLIKGKMRSKLQNKSAYTELIICF
jgi:hypothetical protein